MVKFKVLYAGKPLDILVVVLKDLKPVDPFVCEGEEKMIDEYR